MVLDVGGGTSTLLFGALGAQYGFKVLSLENHGPIARNLWKSVVRYGLTEVVSIQRCALVRKRYADGHRYRWYNANLGATGRPFDLVLIDGPLESLVGRNGAIPELARYLAPHHKILLDDYKRPGEQAAVEEWKRYFPSLQVRSTKAGKGLAELELRAEGQ
jgi:hypothetical protein